MRGVIVKLVDVGYVLKVTEVKNGYIYVIEGKNGAYKVYSKREFDVDSDVYVYSDGDRYFISDK